MNGLRDRKEAGRLLAAKLGRYFGNADVVVLGLPRGGVEVAYEIARILQVPLDVFLVRKLGVPSHEELAMGAVSTGGVGVIDADVVAALGLHQQEIDRLVSAEVREMQRREWVCRGTRAPLNVRGRTVILVDDGIATGSTIIAAIAALRELQPARIVVAAGVAPWSTYLGLAGKADEVVCLITPREFYSVGSFYEEFPQLTDDDVLDFLNRSDSSTAHSLS